MSPDSNFQKDWETIRKKLVDFSEDALKLAHKGEKEIVRLSAEGKKALDSATLSMKKEQLFYLVGKEYIKAKCPGQPNARISKLLEEFNTLEKKQRKLKTVKKK